MMGTTHIAVGLAAGLVALQPQAIVACVPVAAGAVLGAAVCDVDAWASKGGRRVRRGALLVCALVVALLAADVYLQAGAAAWVLAHLGPRVCVGLVAFAATCVFAARTRHRTFAHSLLGLALMAGALWLACAPLAPAFALGYTSHVVLDLLNYKPVGLLYPLRRGISLKLYKARGAANGVFLVLGCAVCLLEFAACLAASGVIPA